ncbi:MAG: cytochrome P460 family protein [Gammaproteobacteria bacterium]|nr:cytochrome P460 family protein [Gammaproteobacteria bacterium]
MKRNVNNLLLTIIALGLALLVRAPFADEHGPGAAPNGITLPQDYKDWRVIGSSHRVDNNTLRVILGNDTAIEAARAGNTNPWPDGTILGKLVWKDTSHAAWEKAVVPGEFVHAEFMLKDAEKWPATGGWGYARWKGMDQTPYGKDASFVQECHGCHTPVKDNDFVFTHPATIP